MFPSFEIFGREIYMYSVCAFVGILLCGLFCAVQIKKKGHDYTEMLLMLLFAFFGAIIGSHILYGITNIPHIINIFNHLEMIKSFDDVLNLSYMVFGGSVFYGGLIGGCLFGLAYLKIRKLNVTLYADIVTPTIPLFHFFGRLGCFFAGCCYGIESDFGYTFTNSLSESANGVKRFPIAIVEAIFNLLLFIALYIVLKKKKMTGKMLYLYLIIYPIGRFCFEFLRGDEIRGKFLLFTTSQWISIILLVFSVSVLLIKHFNSRKRIN